MSRFWQHFITNGGETPADEPNNTREQPEPEDVLDAFSNAVISVADKLRPILESIISKLRAFVS